eukprot:gene21757-24673_t
MAVLPKVWRISSINVPLAMDPGKDDLTVHSPLIRSVSEMIDVPVKRLSSCDIVIVKKSYDGRKRKSVSPGFTYVVDITAGPGPALKINAKAGKVELKDGNSDVNVVATNLLDFASQLRSSEADIPKVVVVGAGPAGLFAALALVEAGVKPTIIERGQPVEKRSRAIGALLNKRLLDPESNLCYGEGGAGTWSDGKLTTGTGKNSPEVRWVMQQLVNRGAPERILVDGKPHLGTDRLVTILKGLREYLTFKGATFKFEHRVDELEIEETATHVEKTSSRRIAGLRVTPLEHAANESEISSSSGAANSHFVPADVLVLAVGHSARNLYRALHSQYGVQLTAKPIAAGFRVEHPQELINRIQYGAETAGQCDRGKGKVPVADYKLAAEVRVVGADGAEEPENRQCYSFCMCPGGIIVPTSVNAEELCINGMSFSRRQSQWANSALVVNVNPEYTHFTPSLTGRDAAFEPSNVDHDGVAGVSSPAPDTNNILNERNAASVAQSPLQGIYWQEEMERRAAKMGGENFVVPVQRVTDFLAGTNPVTPADESTSSASADPAAPASPISSSYRLGVREAPLHELYPPFVTKTIRAALLDFERTMPGFISPDAILHGVETRTSSPVQITRHRDSCESVSLSGLYPAGEGAGYAGGIVSAAVDGLRVAQAILAKMVSKISSNIES